MTDEDLSTMNIWTVYSMFGNPLEAAKAIVPGAELPIVHVDHLRALQERAETELARRGLTLEELERIMGDPHYYEPIMRVIREGGGF